MSGHYPTGVTDTDIDRAWGYIGDEADRWCANCKKVRPGLEHRDEFFCDVCGETTCLDEEP